MTEISVNVDQSDLLTALRQLRDVRNGVPIVMTRALNATAAKAKTASSLEIRKQVKLKAGFVGKELRIKRATYGNLVSVLSARRFPVLMTRYPFSLLKRGGVSVQIKPIGGRKKMPGAFILESKYKDGQVIALPRTANPDKAVVLYSPSVRQVFTTVKDDVMEPMQDVLRANLGNQIDYLLSTL